MPKKHLSDRHAIESITKFIHSSPLFRKLNDFGPPFSGSKFLDDGPYLGRPPQVILIVKENGNFELHVLAHG